MLPGAVLGVAIAWALAATSRTRWCGSWSARSGRVRAQRLVRRPADHRQATSAAAGVFWGAAAGFTSTLAQAGAPPFQVFVLPQRLPKLTLVGTNVVLFAAINVLKLGPYFALGQFSAKGLATSAVLMPLAVATNFLGIWLVRITPTRLFYRIAYVLVFLISLALIWQGAADYWPA